jgi:hypothetical protein
VSGEELLGKKIAGQFVGTVGKEDEEGMKHTTTVRAKVSYAACASIDNRIYE